MPIDSNTIDNSNTFALSLVSGQQVRPRMPAVQCNVNQDIALPNADPHLYSIFPPSGVEGQTLTVIVHTYIPVPVKIAFNQYIVETQRQNTQGKVSLVTKVPSFEEVASTLFVAM
ncbi:hypothetical protein G6F57_020842 [Rhizopus arrhizus]|nr:hypothetical protein G6F57_020842 [Rhizopus arrhizus]